MNGYEPILAICDREMNYACHLMEYLRDHTGIPCRIKVFSSEDKLLSLVDPGETALLVIAESSYTEEIRKTGFRSTLILNESERYLEDIPNISKYQSMQTISVVITNLMMGSDDIVTPSIRHGRPLRILGFYTPVSRCLQTTAAFSLGEILSRKQKVLYLNFEPFSGLPRLCGREEDRNKGNLMDILYYSDCAKDKFSAQLSSSIVNIGGMDVIPPSGYFTEIREVKLQQWLNLFEMINKVTEYEFLILDLTELPEALLDILRRCDRVYSFERDDDISRAKMASYEEMLRSLHYEDVFMKTLRCRLPVFRELPAHLSNMDRGDIGEYIKKLLSEEGYDRL